MEKSLGNSHSAERVDHNQQAGWPAVNPPNEEPRGSRFLSSEVSYATSSPDPGLSQWEIDQFKNIPLP